MPNPFIFDGLSPLSWLLFIVPFSALPYADHMPYTHQLSWEEPNLLAYVKKALQVLERQPNGYFLFIESGRIDHAHHDNEGR